MFCSSCRLSLYFISFLYLLFHISLLHFFHAVLFPRFLIASLPPSRVWNEDTLSSSFVTFHINRTSICSPNSFPYFRYLRWMMRSKSASCAHTPRNCLGVPLILPLSCVSLPFACLRKTRLRLQEQSVG